MRRNEQLKSLTEKRNLLQLQSAEADTLYENIKNKYEQNNSGGGNNKISKKRDGSVQSALDDNTGAGQGAKDGQAAEEEDRYLRQVREKFDVSM